LKFIENSGKKSVQKVGGQFEEDVCGAKKGLFPGCSGILFLLAFDCGGFEVFFLLSFSFEIGFWRTIFFNFFISYFGVKPLRFASGDNNDGDEAIHAAPVFYPSAETFGSRKKSPIENRDGE